jgi:ribosome-associated protein
LQGSSNMDTRMIQVTESIFLDESEIRQDFVRSSGPGGQNVNKVSTSVQLRFDVRNSPSLPAEVRDRLIRQAGRRITVDGVLIIEGRRFRTQEANRKDTVDRLIALIRKAAVRPKTRRRTRPTLQSKRRRLESKRRRSEIKMHRKPVEKE